MREGHCWKVAAQILGLEREFGRLRTRSEQLAREATMIEKAAGAGSALAVSSQGAGQRLTYRLNCNGAAGTQKTSFKVRFAHFSVAVASALLLLAAIVGSKHYF